MRAISLHVLSIGVLLAVVFYSYCDGYHVPAESSSLTKMNEIKDLPRRERRQVETFDDEYPTAASADAQEETGFWDRVVQVALKLFSKFIEWLNS